MSVPPLRPEPEDFVERIWARDPTIWTGRDEADWLGWLDEPWRMENQLQELQDLRRDEFDDVVLLGMGGSSLAPEVLRRMFSVDRFHVLDTTHPAAIRRLEETIEPSRTLFVAASKSGSTIETRTQLDYFRPRAGAVAAITDPGSELDTDEFLWVAHGEPTIGGRYSALSPFGIVPAALMGLQVEPLLQGARVMAEACIAPDSNPGLALGRELAETQFLEIVGDFGLWVEQLVAESTGKEGKGIVPVVVPGETSVGAAELGGQFFRWEFATAVAGALLGLHPFDQPDVQAAKDKTSEILARGSDIPLEQEGSVEELLAGAEPPQYIALLAFVDPAREAQLEPLAERARATGCVVTTGLGPRYLHSTGQLHKGGPDLGLFIQVVDELGEELPIPGRDFGFRRLISAQAAGDFEALKACGRRVVRVRLEDV